MRSAAGGPVVVTLWRVRTQSSRCLLRTHVWLVVAAVLCGAFAEGGGSGGEGKIEGRNGEGVR